MFRGRSTGCRFSSAWRIMEDLVSSLLADDRMLQTDASSSVEVTLHRQGGAGRLVLQLVNETGQDGVEFRDPVPIRDIQMKVRADAVTSVCALWCDRSLTFTEEDGWVSFLLPRLDLYDLVVIE